ncbi:MAG: hypothetical protein LIP11_18305, partial [Clostridiales bacterium]|nr:hypothetical protein [Clostridiales bacterium]
LWEVPPEEAALAWAVPEAAWEAVVSGILRRAVQDADFSEDSGLSGAEADITAVAAAVAS